MASPPASPSRQLGLMPSLCVVRGDTVGEDASGSSRITSRFLAASGAARAWAARLPCWSRTTTTSWSVWKTWGNLARDMPIWLGRSSTWPRSGPSWSGPVPGRPRPGLRPGPWPPSSSNCSASRRSATWSRSGRSRSLPSQAVSPNSGRCATPAPCTPSTPIRTSSSRPSSTAPRNKATRSAGSWRSAWRACPSGWARTPNGTRSSTACWRKR